MSGPLRSVAVVGGGLLAMVAAAAFARALPRARVVVVPAPVAPDALADRWPATLPRAAAALDALGIDRDAWLAGGLATERLATRFERWGRDGAAWWVGDGDLAAGPPGVPLHQLWLRAGGAAAVPLHALSPAVALAAAGRRPPTAADAASPWARVEPALILDPAHAGLLAAAARDRGVVAAPPLAGAAVAAGRIAALALADGGRLEADLVVDIGGPPAPVAAQLSGWEDWSGELPCDRLLVGPVPAQPAALDRYHAGEAGWRGEWAGRPVLGYAAAATDEWQARRLVPGEAELVALRPGRRAAAWTGNCLALGEAAAQPGPLGRAGFALALAQLHLALDLLPGRDMEPLLVAEYNRRAAQRADRLRDWLAAHYRAGGRRPGAVWRALAAAPPPPGLVATLAQVERRGHLPRADDDLVGRDAWLAVLLGPGLRPALADPIARGVEPAVARATVCALAADLAARAAALPVGAGIGVVR